MDRTLYDAKRRRRPFPPNITMLYFRIQRQLLLRDLNTTSNVDLFHRFFSNVEELNMDAPILQNRIVIGVRHSILQVSCILTLMSFFSCILTPMNFVSSCILTLISLVLFLYTHSLELSTLLYTHSVYFVYTWTCAWAQYILVYSVILLFFSTQFIADIVNDLVTRERRDTYERFNGVRF